jgi:hypothetical protein
MGNSRMEINALPRYDMSDNPTNCCPRFNFKGWDEQELHFRDKLFIRARTRSIFHIPINMGTVFSRVLDAIKNSGGIDENNFIVLSRVPSPWTSEHYFAVDREIPGFEMVRLSGDFLTRVYEGPYKHAPQWEQDMQSFVERTGHILKKTYFFFTTCPGCAKYYGRNYVVLVAEFE